MANPWFRFYTEALDDDKLRLLAFEDRWHFVSLLCLKGNGLLDDDCSKELLLRRVAVKMGLSVRELEEVARRLAEVELIDKETLQPLKWEARQFASDSSSDRVKQYRDRKKQEKQACNVDETLQQRSSNVLDTDTDTDTESEEEKKKVKNIAPQSVAPIPEPKKIDLAPSKPKVARPDDVPEQVWFDYLANRKSQRKPLTQTGLDAIRKQASLAHMTLEAALRKCCERGWVGFEAEWVLKDRGKPAQSGETPYQRSMRERVEQMAPRVAAKPPSTGQVIDIQAVEFFERESRAAVAIG